MTGTPERSPRFTWPTWIAIVVLGGASASFGGWLAHQRDLAAAARGSDLSTVAPGDPVPDLRLPDLRTGTPTPLARPGRARLLNYWASWCAPCRAEMPLLDAFATGQGADGVEVVGIALETPAEATRFLADVPVAFPLLWETPGPADSSVRLGNRRGVLPYSVLVSADGRVLKTHVGPFPDAAAIEAWARPN